MESTTGQHSERVIESLWFYRSHAEHTGLANEPKPLSHLIVVINKKPGAWPGSLQRRVTASGVASQCRYGRREDSVECGDARNVPVVERSLVCLAEVNVRVHGLQGAGVARVVEAHRMADLVRRHAQEVKCVRRATKSPIPVITVDLVELKDGSATAAPYMGYSDRAAASGVPKRNGVTAIRGRAWRDRRRVVVTDDVCTSGRLPRLHNVPARTLVLFHAVSLRSPERLGDVNIYPVRVEMAGWRLARANCLLISPTHRFNANGSVSSSATRIGCSRAVTSRN